MKTLSTTWKNYLAGGGTSLAMCIKVMLVDGSVYGFTTSSNEITYQGVVYYPAMGVTPSAIESGDDLSPGNAEVASFFAADGVLLTDIQGGKFNSATHETIVVNYDDLSMGHIDFLDGPLGLIKSKGNAFVFELKDWLDKLTRKTGASTSPYCRVKRLGDEVCGVKMKPNLATTSLSTAYLDVAGTFDSPFDASGVSINIMNDGRLSVYMYASSGAVRNTTVRSYPDLVVQETLPNLGAASNPRSGVLVNQYGDMFDGVTYRKKGGANTLIGVDFHTRGAMDLDGRFYTACRWFTSPPQTSALFVIQTDGTIQKFDIPGTSTPIDFWYGHNGYAYISMNTGFGSGPLLKVDVLTGAVVKTSTVIDDFSGLVAASDDSVWYISGDQIYKRMEPTWTSAATIFDYGTSSTSQTYEMLGRDWENGGVVAGFHEEFHRYLANGTGIEAIAYPLAITGYKIATHPSFPDRIIYSDSRPFGGIGNKFVAQVLRPINGESTIWTPFTAVTSKVIGDAKIGSAVRPGVFNGLYYVCSQSGLTGSTEPIWNTTAGVEFSDGSAKWIGRIANTWPRTVSAVTDRHTFAFSGAGAPAADLFKYGIIRWLTGANAGIEMEIASNTSSTITTYLPAPSDIQIGDACEVERGCNRSKEICTGEFSNIHNFDGEPQKPAADFLISYTTR